MTDRDEAMASWIEKFVALHKEVTELKRLSDSMEVGPDEVDRKFLSISKRMEEHYEHGREVFKGIRRIEELIEQGENKRKEMLGRFGANSLGMAGMKPPSNRSN